MSDELQLWVRLVQNVIALVLVIPAAAYCFALWLESRRLYLAFGTMALLVLALLALLRIVDVPEPPLLSQDFIDIASLLVNAVWPLFGLAWLAMLAMLLRERLRLNRLRKRLGLEPEGENQDG